jgi:hypothetical protein
MTDDSGKQHVEIKMNTRGQGEQNPAKVLRFKQFYYGIYLLVFKFDTRGATVRLKF